MDTPLYTASVNLPGIACTAASPVEAVYSGEETVLGFYLTFRVAGVLATDAEVGTDVTSISLRDGDAEIFKTLTPVELRAVYDQTHSRYGAAAADLGILRYVALPDEVELAIMRAHYGLGRKSDDGLGVSKLKIEVQWAAGPLTITSCIPTIIFDPTEKLAFLGRHQRIVVLPSTHVGATMQTMQNVFQDKHMVGLRKMWFDISTGVIGDITVKQGLESRFSAIPLPAILGEMHRAGQVAVAAVVTLNFDSQTSPSSQLGLIGKAPVEMNVNWTTNPAGPLRHICFGEYQGHEAV